MAFQIPLMRSDYDIYKMNGAKGRQVAAKQSNGRSRKTSEPTSLSTSPGQNDFSPSHRNLHHVSSAAARYQFTRVGSRTSQSSLIMSPTRSQSMHNTSPPKPVKADSQNSLNKFHNRLVDKLRKAFKSSSSSAADDTRSWKSHSIDLSSPFRRPSTDVHKKLVSASSAEIAALERQFQLIQTDSDEDEDEDESSEDQHQCDEKFILI
jgi:hypothetical protein